MRKILITFSFALLVLPLQAVPQVYKWVDEHGKTVYSSTPPPPGAKKSTVVPMPASPPPAEPAKADPKKAAAKPAPDVASAVSYTSLQITTPTPEETIGSNTGEVPVSLALEPALQKGHKVRVLVNGVPHGEPWEAPQGTLRNLDRGGYTVQAEVIDGRGSTVASTNSVTFYVQQASALSPTRKTPATPATPPKK